MKILLLSQYYWPETFGITALARALKTSGSDVTVLTGKPNYPDGKVFPGYKAWGTQRDCNDEIEVLRVPLFPRGKNSGWRLALNYLSFIFSGLLFGPWLLRRRQFDVVVVYAPSPLLQALPAIWLAFLWRAPLAVWVQDLWPESLSATGFVRNRFALGMVERLVRFIYRHTDLILIPSEAFRRPIERLADDRGKICYYPNAYAEELAPSMPSEAVQALRERISDGFSIVFAGNLGTAQALDTVVDAAEILQGRGVACRFFLIGSGSQSAWMAEETRRRGLRNVVMPGRFPSEAMPHFLAVASVLLVSLRDEPIFALTIPSKVQGYMAAGRPIVASLNGEGARVVTTAGAGVACPAGDAQALASAVETLLDLRADERAKMGENARRYALANFSLGRLAAELADLLGKLVPNCGENHR